MPKQKPSKKKTVKSQKTDNIYRVPVSRAPMKANRTGSWRYLAPFVNLKNPPCRAACPLAVPVSEFIHLIETGRPNDAAKEIINENPFPAICGRICVHPCEDRCIRGQFDQGLAIHMLERYAGDNSYPLKINIDKLNDKNIAVVGAGPSGLSAAYFLLRMGYHVTIFEANDEPGGIIRYGIPEYRMPRSDLKKALENVLSLGPVLKTGTALGKNLSFSDLDKFDAVFLGTGAHRGKDTELHSQNPGDIISGIDMLRRIAFGEHAGIGSRVIIIGGGNTAIDTARSLLRIGKKPVILYRRGIEDMPAFAKEVREALREGIDIEPLALVKEIIKEGDKVIGARCVKVELDKDDKTGKTNFTELENTYFFMEADNIVSATGEIPDLEIFPQGINWDGDKLFINEFAMTGMPRVYAGGDLVRQPHLVVHALASGKKAAISMDASFSGIDQAEAFRLINIAGNGLSFGEYLRIRPGLIRKKKMKPGLPADVCGFDEINLDYFDHAERAREKKLSLSERVNTFHEVHAGYDRGTSLNESGRCFHCGSCILCDNCIVYCPDISISENKKENHVVIDYEYCKGCGLCAEECPRGVIDMKRESEG
jgi:2-oxoacid:acceptor oxidoreductase delta subunit (pyruvate/2-ketoisovalerate family)